MVLHRPPLPLGDRKNDQYGKSVTLSYSGEEKLVVSVCVDKTSTRPWQASFNVDRDSYTGKGSTSGRNFTFKGKVADGTAQGTVEGRTPVGRLWEGKTNATVSPDAAFVMPINGKVPTAGCDIFVTINANKAGS